MTAADGPAPAFEHLDDRIVHQGHVWDVVVASFRAPDGEVFERDVVRSPGAVAIVPIEREDDGTPVVVLIRQYRAPFDELVVELPAGMRDVDGEPPEVTAGRELEEEVGLRAARVVPLTTYYPSPGMTDSTMSLYMALDLTPVAVARHGPEERHLEVLRLGLSEAVDHVERGEIRNAATAIGLLLAERWLEHHR